MRSASARASSQLLNHWICAGRSAVTEGADIAGAGAAESGCEAASERSVPSSVIEFMSVSSID